VDTGRPSLSRKKGPLRTDGLVPLRTDRRAGSLAVVSGVVPILFLGLFLVYPLVRILSQGLGPILAGGGEALRRVLVDTALARLLGASALQALLSTLLTLAVGLPAAYAFARYDFPGKTLLRTLLSIPFVLPTVVVASAFVVLIGPAGILERAAALLTGNPRIHVSLLRTLGAVLMAHVFYNVSIIVRIVGGFWAALDPRLEEAARVLGAGRVSSFLRVTTRLLLAPVGAASLLVFAFCFASFGVVLMLGGPRTGTLETEIYRQAVGLFNLPAAAFVSATQLVTSAIVLFAYSRLQARLAISRSLRVALYHRPRTAAQWVAVSVCGVAPAVALLAPMAALVLGSVLTRTGFSFAYWKALFSPTGHSLFWTSPLTAAGHSFLFALEATALALALGIPAAYLISRSQGSADRSLARGTGTAADLLFLLPLGTSAVTLGLGYIISLNVPPIDLRASALIIPIAHALVALPLVVRSLLPPLRAINPRVREAASILGATTVQVRMEIDLPLLRNAFIAAAAFAFTVSLGEFAATALLTRPELMTLPVLVYNSFSRPGELNQGQALALATVLMAACGLGLAAIERFRTEGREAF